MLSIHILILFSLTVICQCRESIDIAGISTDDGFSKCNSGGEWEHTYGHSLGTLDEYHLKYEELDKLSTVIVHFRTMQVETKAVKNAAVKFLLLHDYVQYSDHKEYEGSTGYDAVCGWASQLVKISVTVRFYKSGNIKLDNKLKAGSWGAVSCAYVTSGISRIQVIY